MNKNKNEVSKDKKKNKIGKNIFSIIVAVIFIFCVIFIFKSIKANKTNTLPFVFGLSYSVVPTPSMEDTINVNDLVIIKQVDYEDIDTNGNDIIVYFSKTNNIFIVHRVIGAYDDGSLKTKGDNQETNPVEDSDPDLYDSYKGVTKELYVGKVVKHGKFLGLGWLINHGRFFIFLAVMGIFIYLLISEFININKIIKEKNKMQIEEENNKIDIEEERERLRKEVMEELKKEQDEKDS